MIDINKPVTNPQLLEAIDAMKLNNSTENQDKVINEVMRAHFLSPVTITPTPESNDSGATVLKEKTTISFHMIEDNMNNSYFLAFTDWDELRKWNNTENIQTLISTFDDYAAMITGENGRSDGFVINPFSSNLPFSRAMIESLKIQKEKNPNTGSVEYTVEKDTEVLLGQPSVYPTDMVNTLINYLKNQKEIEKAYLLLMVKPEVNESSYLLIIDFKGNKKDTFDGIAKIANPFLNGMYLDMVTYDSEFGKNAVGKTEPFYKKKRFGIF